MTMPLMPPKKVRWPWILLGAFVLTVLYRGCTAPNSTRAAAEQRGTGLSESSKTTLAAMINVNGELCAKVTGVSAMGNDVYEVACQRYRDGTGMATYHVDLKTGRVK